MTINEIADTHFNCLFSLYQEIIEKKYLYQSCDDVFEKFIFNPLLLENKLRKQKKIDKVIRPYFRIKHTSSTSRLVAYSPPPSPHLSRPTILTIISRTFSRVFKKRRINIMKNSLSPRRIFVWWWGRKYKLKCDARCLLTAINWLCIIESLSLSLARSLE